MTLTRYEEHPDGGLREDELGMWIKHTDHISALEAVKATVGTPFSRTGGDTTFKFNDDGTFVLNEPTSPPHQNVMVALTKINDIRNSIIGFQTVNWSEHIYPLVAALEEAGIEGAGYPASRANVGTMLDRTLAAENEVISLRASLEANQQVIETLRAALEWYTNPEVYRPHPHGSAFDKRDLSYVARAALTPTQDEVSK